VTPVGGAARVHAFAVVEFTVEPEFDVAWTV
jgi:hypothetical protein